VKIDINLVRPRSRLERLSWVWAPLIIVIAAALLTRIVSSAWINFSQYRAVHRSVMRYKAETQELQRREARTWQTLHKPAAERLYRKIDLLNALIEEKKLLLSDLALKVAKLLPAQTRLNSLALAEEKEGPIVEFSVEGQQDGVYSFLSRLETSPDFDSPTVTDQSIGQQGSDKGLVILECSARYVGANLTQSGRAER
jgi:hypothetical protein